MRLIIWVTALAVLNLACAKNTTAKTKPKRQLDNIRTPQNLQYSLVLPHSRVAHFRALPTNRRISNVSPRTGNLPPYAVQMEPVVQYSQKDPLYDPTHHLDNTGVNKNEIFAQPKILNVHDQEPEGSFGSPYGVLPTAPLYSEDYQPNYYDGPEPIIEIIIKESNETLPPQPPPPIQKKKKEPVQVFYVKYSKDPHSKDKVIYEQPIPAITPPSNDEDDHHQDYVTVTPEPLYKPPQTTTLRAIIKPESELYHSNSNVKITFGNEHHHHDNRRAENQQGEDREETAPRPAIALPNQQQNGISLERSASPRPQYEQEAKHNNQAAQQIYLSGQHAQSRIQFQQPYINHEPQLPRQGPSAVPFRAQIPRQNPFGPSPSLSPRPSFASPSPSPGNHFANAAPTVPGPIIPFARPSNQPQFHGRPNSLPAFGTRQHTNGPPRASFHSGPQRPFHQQQHQTFFDEAKYLQENYHTITTDQIDSQKSQLPNRQTPNINSNLKPTSNPPLVYFPDHLNRPQQLIPYNQQLPQQRPPQVFDLHQNKSPFAITPSRSPFFNLKPSPPYVEENRTPFQRQPSPHLSQQHINYHQSPQSQPRPSVQISHQENSHTQNSFSSVISPSPSPALIPQSQFLPQPSPTPIFDFNQQQSLNPNQFHNINQQSVASERPNQFKNFQPTPNFEHQQNINQFAPKGSELVAAIPKYEQHYTVNDANGQSNFNGLINSNQPIPTVSQADSQQQQQQLQKQQAQSQYDAEQEQVRVQLAHNVRKQQEEIQRLQSQLQFAQQQHQQQQQQQQQQHQQQQQQQQQQQLQQHQQQQYQQQQTQQNYNQYNQQQFQQSTANPQYIEERSRLQSNYVTSSPSPLYYQSTSRTVEIKPTTQKHVSSTEHSVSSTPAPQKIENKKRPAIELPDEVPDDLRQQLLSSGILDNADISVLDYDKVGETPLESLPPDQLANFFGAGGGQQIASSEHRPIVVTPNGDRLESRMDESIDDDQEIAASENVPSYISPTQKQAVEMKVVHFDPKTPEGQKVASDLVKEDATQVDPVALNDKKYNRYLPLKVSGNKFPLPDVLKGRKITSVVVLAPVETETLGNEHLRSERSATENLKGIKFVAGESLQNLLKKPTEDNFKKWLETENKTATDQQSVILLVTGDEEPSEGREIFMYDITSGNVNKLSGDLSNAFVEAAENNSLSKDIESLAIEGEGTPESFNKENDDEALAEGSENVPLFVDLSGAKLNDKNSNKVLISSGYSKTKKGRAIKRH